jgi:methionyl-tRNA formyltransferase
MNISLLGSKGTTYDLLNQFIESKTIKINSVFSLHPEVAKKNNVAYYFGEKIESICNGYEIDFLYLRNYSMKDKEELEKIKAHKIDLLLVIGWERIIPSELLESLNFFACGMHGSFFGLPKGRGRSPLNWSLINGYNKFITYLFKYDIHADNGPIIGFKVFDINVTDDIITLHQKNRIAMFQLVETYLPLIEKNEQQYFFQPPALATYYPKRKPEDGWIDWNKPVNEVYNLTRALKPPYPPSFFYYKQSKVEIHDAVPFDTGLYHHSIKPGTILDISLSTNSLVIKCSDSSLLIKNFSGIAINEFLLKDCILSSNSSEILESIKSRYADLPSNQREII